MHNYRALDDATRKQRLDGRLKAVFRAIYDNKFGPLTDEIKSYIGKIESGSDFYCVSLDFDSYLKA